MVDRHPLKVVIWLLVGLTLATGLAGAMTTPSIPPPPPEDEPLIRYGSEFFLREVAVGEETTVGMLFTNVGGVDATVTYSLSMNGSQIGEREFRLQSEETRRIRFTVDVETHGAHLLNQTVSYDNSTSSWYRGMLLADEPAPETLIVGLNHSSIPLNESTEYWTAGMYHPIEEYRWDMDEIATVTVDDPTVASVTPPAGHQDGRVHARSPGRTSVLVEYGGVQNATPLTVGAQNVSIAVEEAPLERTETTDVHVFLEFVDGSQIDVTEEAAIASTNESIATVTGTRVVGNATGNTTLEATFEEWTANTTVTVTEQTDVARDTPADGSSGFGVVATLGLIGLALVAAGRYSQQSN